MKELVKYKCIEDCRFFEDLTLPCLPLSKNNIYFISKSGYIYTNDIIPIVISKVNVDDIFNFFDVMVLDDSDKYYVQC